MFRVLLYSISATRLTILIPMTETTTIIKDSVTLELLLLLEAGVIDGEILSVSVSLSLSLSLSLRSSPISNESEDEGEAVRSEEPL